MAAITQIALTRPKGQTCETIAILNQTTASVAVVKAIPVPPWARQCILIIEDLTLAGTSPLFDFKVEGVDIGVTNTPDDGDLFALGGWDGITQKTGATASQTIIDIGTHVTADDTGSATVSDRYGVTSALPAWIAYTYTTDGTTDDEDYDAVITVQFAAG